MIGFGLVSSVFDLITFVMLLFVFHASVEEFQTSWFIESLLTEIFIIFVVRTYRPFYRSKPDRWLVIASLIVILLMIAILLSPLKSYFGFVSLSNHFILGILAISGIYVAMSEALKRLIMVSPSSSRTT